MKYTILTAFIFLQCALFAQTIEIHGKKYLPDTLATNDNFIIIRYEAVSDTLQVKEKMKEIDDEVQRINDEIAMLQERLTSLTKDKGKFDKVLKDEKDKDKDKVKIQMVEPKKKTIFKKSNN